LSENPDRVEVAGHMEDLTPTVAPAPPALPEADSLILPPDILSRIDFTSCFPSNQPVELELGAGDGSFLLRYSALHPERNFLGVERLLGRLRKIDRKGRRLGLTNLRALRLEAAYVLEWMIQPASLSALHVYFPDPWPKRRHWRRRLINERFTCLAARALQPGGRFYVRTDDASYFEQMLEVGNAQPLFQKVEEPTELLGVITDFEADFNRDGIATRHAAWERKPDAPVQHPSPQAHAGP
jgi:tRNA (guanine-N7-)-methyltransferase